MSDPNAIDLQTWQDVVTAIEQALQMDGAKIYRERVYRDEAAETDAALEVTLPSGKVVYVEVTEVPDDV